MGRKSSCFATILLLSASAAFAVELQPVTCRGYYARHLQGACAGNDSIFWCFTTKLVKTDPAGKVLKEIDVADHHGDLCFQADKIYVAVNLGKFNQPGGKADSWVYQYHAADLSLVAKHKTPEVVYGAGGIAYHEGQFLVIGGLPPGVEDNYAYEYDRNLKFVAKRVVNSGHTAMGIQTAAFAEDHWWFGCYGTPRSTLKVDRSFQRVERFEFDCAVGIVPLGDGQFLVGRDTASSGRHQGSLAAAETDKRHGLKLVQSGP